MKLLKATIRHPVQCFETFSVRKICKHGFTNKLIAFNKSL